MTCVLVASFAVALVRAWALLQGRHVGPAAPLRGPAEPVSDQPLS